MTTPRRAFVMSSIEQYLALIINVTVVATMARLLTPDAIGHAVTGIGLGAIALSLREFVTPEFLISKREIDRCDLRTSFTLLFLITALIAAGLAALSPRIATFYGSPELPLFLFLVMLSAFAEVISLPIVAILRRNMAFGVLANIRTAALLISALVTISLGMLGFGYVSYGWGMLTSAVTVTILTILFTPFSFSSMCKPSLVSWRAVYEFGRFKGASQAIDRIYENVPQLILGKVISMTSVGLYNRANTVCGIPDRIIMSAFYAMAFPALAASVREGKDIKRAYLNTVSYLSVLYMPGVLMIAVTADRIVHLVLGSQWEEAILLVRLMALAAVFWFAVIVTNPLLLALQQNRDAFLSSLLSRSVAGVALCTASTYGVLAMALSQFISLPLQMLIAIYFARKHLNFTIAEFLSAVYPSLVVTLFALAGPTVLLISDVEDMNMSPLEFGLALLCAGWGWLIGLVVTKHPFLTEIHLIVQFMKGASGRLRRHFMAAGA
ncbi:oligosaccharide flippase family protein [Neorhizobium alkalisoli]|uniref:O-antigen/teichoic acid export membrane protein n=1 Tax=Neorhizobium alkalisoli TaxID=528178 RepID=A0A561QCI4_9HYPH|nr:oligosaccharide flippase family protein [Neorhizobium alkalisoli]TWF48084.1 O-antigen/teichoic acid export membrane protein [Neorhizobium alkalisoli]